jgi:hypothetical protein
MLCPEALEFGSLGLRSGIYAIKRRFRPHCEEFFDVGFCQQPTRVLTGVFMRIAGGSSGLGTVETARQVVNREKLMLQPETLQVTSSPNGRFSEFERDNSAVTRLWLRRRENSGNQLPAVFVASPGRASPETSARLSTRTHPRTGRDSAHPYRAMIYPTSKP